MVLRRVLRLRRGPAVGFTVEKDSQKGSGVFRRCLERALGEYDPLSMHPSVLERLRGRN